LGIPYDSDSGRLVAGLVTSALSAQGYEISAKLASMFGPFARYEANKESMHRVMQLHFDAHQRLGNTQSQDTNLYSIPNGIYDLGDVTYNLWDRNINSNHTGWKNAQISVLMPAGTCGIQ